MTGITFGIAVLAIAGTPFLSGYYSKDLILANAAAFGVLAEEAGRSTYYWAFFVIPTIIAYVTAFYMTRCWMLTFAGKPRNEHLHEHAHESPVLWVPLVALAVLSIIGGKFLGVRELLKNSIAESNNYCNRLIASNPAYADRTFNGFGTAWPGDEPGHGPGEPAEAAVPEEPPVVEEVVTGEPNPDHGAAAHTAGDVLEHGYHLMHTYVFWAFVVGIGLGVALYVRGYAIVSRLVRVPPLGWIHTWLYRRMYFDELYYFVFVAITMGLSRFSAWFDRNVVDGLVNMAAGAVRRGSDLIGAHDKYVVDGAVNGVGKLTYDLGAAVRNPSTGRVRLYVTALMVAVALGLAGAIIVALS